MENQGCHPAFWCKHLDGRGEHHKTLETHVPVSLKVCCLWQRRCFSFALLLNLYSYSIREPRSPRKSKVRMALAIHFQKGCWEMRHFSANAFYLLPALMNIPEFEATRSHSKFLLLFPAALGWKKNKISCCLSVLCCSFWSGLCQLIKLWILFLTDWLARSFHWFFSLEGICVLLHHLQVRMQKEHAPPFTFINSKCCTWGKSLGTASFQKGVPKEQAFGVKSLRNAFVLQTPLIHSLQMLHGKLGFRLTPSQASAIRCPGLPNSPELKKKRASAFFSWTWLASGTVPPLPFLQGQAETWIWKRITGSSFLGLAACVFQQALGEKAQGAQEEVGGKGESD